MIKPTFRITILLSLILGCSNFVNAQDSSRVKSQYGAKGFEWNTADGNYGLYIGARFQFRYITPFNGNPILYQSLSEPSRQEFVVNRARLKIGGHAYKPYLKYYFEYGLTRGQLLDFRVMIEKWRGLSFKVGQWKVNYNRERVVSSGKQQMVDRSLLNTYFTLDRQQGVSVYGDIGGPSTANFSYELSVVTGAGRSAPANPTNDLMYIGHLQWNFCGSKMPVTESDIPMHAKPVGEIGISAATFKGPFTSFSSAGGSDLFGQPEVLMKAYYVRQANVETAFMYRGFSWQNETHIKRIEDLHTNQTKYMTGVYFQAGYFFHQAISFVPPKLELAARYAVVSPNTDLDNLLRQEYSVAVNYFFRAHRNKLTVEYATLVYDDPLLGMTDRGRFRIQWDISF